jgi:hypothetical protein
MSDDDTITAEAIIDTEYGEKIAISSPYSARHIVKFLPFKQYSEEIDEYGSLKEKASARGTNTKTSELIDVFDAYEAYGFSDDFAAYQSWDSEALGPDDGAWVINSDCWEEAADFFEFAGYTVEVADDVTL